MRASTSGTLIYAISLFLLQETSFCPGDICVVILGQHSLTDERFNPVNGKITYHPTPTPVTI